MKLNIKEQFERLSPGGKKTIIWSLIGVVGLIICISGYNARSEKPKNPTAIKKEKEVRLDADLIDKTVLREQRRKMDDLQNTVDTLQKTLNKTLGEKAAVENLAKETLKEGLKPNLPEKKNGNEKGGNEEPPKIPNADELEKQAASGVPYNPSMTATDGQKRSPSVPLAVPVATPGHPREKKIIGDITVVSNKDQRKDDKKKFRTVYLPPSFMEAELLTGFDAATSGKGKNDPEPMLIRVQTPAVLPNDIKADLAGCFVVAEAVGRLDKERADVRVVSLSCLSNEGRAVIDTQVKGFVTDSDSKVGLAGRVVSRMGAATARTIIAGFFGGAGDMLKSSATTQSVSPLGVTTSVDSSQIAKYAVGGGLSDGAQSLQDFYMSLAKQATPVIEVGATKHITVVISEGKDLEIKDKKPQEYDIQEQFAEESR